MQKVLPGRACVGTEAQTPWAIWGLICWGDSWEEKQNIGGTRWAQWQTKPAKQLRFCRFYQNMSTQVRHLFHKCDLHGKTLRNKTPMPLFKPVSACWCSLGAAVCLLWKCVWIMLSPVIDGKVNHSRQMLCTPKSVLGGVTLCVCMYVYECMDVCLSCIEWVWEQPSQVSGQPAMHALSSSFVTQNSSWDQHAFVAELCLTPSTVNTPRSGQWNHGFSEWLREVSSQRAGTINKPDQTFALNLRNCSPNRDLWEIDQQFRLAGT